jgi:hypothetical protein
MLGMLRGAIAAMMLIQVFSREQLSQLQLSGSLCVGTVAVTGQCFREILLSYQMVEGARLFLIQYFIILVNTH